MKTKLLTPALIVLTAISSLYAYKKHNDNTVLKKELTESVLQKEKTHKQIAELTNSYETINNKNKKLSKRFISEINKIIQLKESVNELDKDLKTDKKIISQKTLLAKNLANENKVLAYQVNEAQSLKISSFNVTKMKRKLNGKYTNTSKTSKTDLFKLNILIDKNELGIPGQKIFHAQVINPDGNIISVHKDVQLNNKIITCSDEIIFDYQKEKLEIVSLIEVNRDSLKPGKYLINAFIDGKLISQRNIKLD